LHDIAARNSGLPLYAFLGGKNNKALKTDYTVSLGVPAKMAQDALKIKDAGFTSVKVKLGDTRENDVERIRLIREAIGPTLPLSIDANQGWDVETAVATLQELAPYNISHCEEPIPRWDFMELPRVRKQSSIPIMADESCADDHDAARLIALNACDYFNVKLGKSGGLFKAKKIISLAEKAGIKMQLGGFLESRLGFTAAAHLALCSDNIIYCDFDTPMMFREDPVQGGIQYGEKGSVSVPQTPGLGAWMDESYLEGLKKIVV
jgi:L-alanine-DL-glutamate epimerase-like enolase superfamily enzyme